MYSFRMRLLFFVIVGRRSQGVVWDPGFFGFVYYILGHRETKNGDFDSMAESSSEGTRRAPGEVEELGK